MERSKAAACKGQAQVPSGNERGVALILALVMLVLMTLLGAWVLDTSSTDLKIAGNSRNAAQAFYAGDAAMNYMSNTNTLTTAYTSMTPTNRNYVLAYPSLPVSTMTGTIKFLQSGPLPAGSAYDADVDYTGQPKFHGLYFAVTGMGSGANHSQAVIESGVVQVVGN